MTTATRLPSEVGHARVSTQRSAPRRNRNGISAVLTGSAIAIAAAMTAAFGLQGLALFAIGLPVPIIILWASSDVFRADEGASND